LWLGFEPRKTSRWLRAAGLARIRLQPLPTDGEAKGPALFAAVAFKPEPGKTKPTKKTRIKRAARTAVGAA
ncbi:MAG: hypothetical protein HKP30_12030, partial [Myxococcales bacterium]|nr:hypothetical protein [Myxococcales bacterium]